MFTMRQLLDLVEGMIQDVTESISRYDAYRSWYSPETKEFVTVMGSDTHASVVVKNPEEFGIDPSRITDAMRANPRQQESLIKPMAFANGWIRVAASDRNNVGKFMIFEGDSAKAISRLFRRFYQDLGSEMQVVAIKAGGQEFVLDTPDKMKAFAMRQELPAPVAAVAKAA